MRSHSRRDPEGAASLLEDSAYEVLGESSYETSDDEGRTESLASEGDGHTPDDVSSVADTEEFEDGDLDDSSQHLTVPFAEPAGSSLGPPSNTDHANDSLMTSRADTHLAESSHIEIEEIPSATLGELKGYGIVRQFDSHEIPEILRLYNSPEIRISVEMFLSQRFLSISRPFRLLYAGEAPSWAKEDINSHIAAALTASSEPQSLASSRSSRFSVVRVPSFPEGTPANRVQLVDSSGIELVVDQCKSACRVSKERGKSQVIEVTLHDGTLLTFGPKKSFHIKGGSGTAALPDLVVFCHDTFQPILNPATMQQGQLDLVREAFKAHSIPSLDIAMVRPFHNCPKSFTFTPATLRSCVEGRSDSDSDFTVLETLPIDIYTFLEITPSQLNRHLALITGSHDGSLRAENLSDKRESRALEKKTTEPHRWSIQELFSASFKNIPGLNWRLFDSISTMDVKKRTFLATLVTLAMMLTAYMAAYGCYSPPGVGGIRKNSDAVTMYCEDSLGSVSTATISSQPTFPPPSTTQAKTFSRDLSMVNPETSLGKPLDHKSLTKNEAEPFKVVLAEDHQFVLSVPSHFARLRKPPQIHIVVRQDSKTIPIRVHRSADSVIVHLREEYPFGLFDVEVQTKSKPLLSQTFTVALGLRWHKLSIRESVERLSQNVKHDIHVAQLSLRNISSQLSKTFQTGLTKFEGGTAAAYGQTKQWKQQVQKSTKSVGAHLQDVKHEAGKRLSSGSQMTKDVSEKIRRNLETCAAMTSDIIRAVPAIVMPDIWQQTAPLRTSPKLLDARRKALRIWEKLGKGERKDRAIPKNSKGRSRGAENR
jgi:hypothetical protein